jgi:hypothetical protein
MSSEEELVIVIVLLLLVIAEVVFGLGRLGVSFFLGRFNLKN